MHKVSCPPQQITSHFHRFIRTPELPVIAEGTILVADSSFKCARDDADQQAAVRSVVATRVLSPVQLLVVVEDLPPMAPFSNVDLSYRHLLPDEVWRKNVDVPRRCP